jgi:hypothetical protein
VVICVPPHNVKIDGQTQMVKYAIDIESAEQTSKEQTSKDPDRSVRLVMSSAKERDEWIRRIERRAALLTQQYTMRCQNEHEMALPAGWEERESTKHPGRYVFHNLANDETSWERPLPEPEPEPEAPVQSEENSLTSVQSLAVRAIAGYEHWKSSVDHSSAYRLTDHHLDILNDAVHRISADSDWELHRTAHVSYIMECQQKAIECIRAERASREICPMLTLRAAVFGVGNNYPQLLPAERCAMAHRYLTARSSSHENTFAMLIADGAVDERLILRNLLAPFGSDADCTDDTCCWSARELSTFLMDDSSISSGDKPMGLVDISASIRALLKTEVAGLNATLSTARDVNIADEIESCRPHVHSPPPDITELERLQEIIHDQNDAVREAAFQQEELQRRMATFNASHPRHPKREEIAVVKQALQKCRRELRTTSKLVDAEMQALARAGSEHWPEVLVKVPSLAEFTQMDGLSNGNLNIDSYDNVEPLVGRGRNDVYTATLDSRRVVIKAYDLTNTTTVKRVMEEVKQLHRMRHPNIVEIEAVFERRVRKETRMYIQMPRYACDLKDWLQKNPRPQVWFISLVSPREFTSNFVIFVTAGEKEEVALGSCASCRSRARIQFYGES